VQYANCSREYGQGKRLTQSSASDVIKHGYEPSGLLYRYDRIEKVVLPNLQRLLRFFREHRLKIVFATLGSRMLDFSDMPSHARALCQWANNREGEREHEILDELKPIEGEYIVNKVTFDAFCSSGIDTLLHSIGAEYLVFGGVDTIFCVGSTARSATDRGYKCVLVEDCCATQAESWQRVCMVSYQRLYSRVDTTSTVISELEGGFR